MSCCNLVDSLLKGREVLKRKLLCIVVTISVLIGYKHAYYCWHCFRNVIPTDNSFYTFQYFGGHCFFTSLKSDGMSLGNFFKHSIRNNFFSHSCFLRNLPVANPCVNGSICVWRFFFFLGLWHERSTPFFVNNFLKLKRRKIYPVLANLSLNVTETLHISLKTLKFQKAFMIALDHIYMSLWCVFISRILTDLI